MDGSAGQSCFFNVGGCFFSIPRARLSYVQDSLLFKDYQNKGRWFIDRDGCTFRHVQYYLQTGKLAASCSSELNILYELTASLRLRSLLQALENFQSGKHYLRARPVDLQVAEKKPRICNKNHPEVFGSPVSSVHDMVPLGLIGTPLIDGDDEVLYCFLPMEQIRLYPELVTPHNLLWLCDKVAIIECDSPLFRFIANFLQTGEILLPEQFSDYKRLNTEAESSGMFHFTKALQESHEASFDGDRHPAAHAKELSPPQPPKPLYEMTFDLLVRYQDSALGQLYVDGDLPGNKLYMCGNGVVFEHVENWLGTSRLPLTERGSELQGLCEYLDRQDEAYQAFREVLWEFLLRRETSAGSFTAWPWSASVATFSVYKVVKVYVGTHWYATYLKTLLKYPALLSNVTKTSWIVFGESLLVKGDGQMFRHVLNFLRCGRLLLPSVFREWQLLVHEIEEFQIPSLSAALKDCTDYRAWSQSREPTQNLSSTAESLLVYDGDQRCPENMDPSSIQVPDSDSQDPFISVDGDVCHFEEAEGAQTPRDTILNPAEGSYIMTEATAGSCQPPSALHRTHPVDMLPSDRLSQPTTSAVSTEISATLTSVFQTKTLNNTELSATQSHDDSTRMSVAVWQMMKSKPVVCGNLSSVCQGSVTISTPEGVRQILSSLHRMIQTGRNAGNLSAPLQSLVQMVKSVFQAGPNTEPWGTPSRPAARAGTTPAAASRVSTSLSLPINTLPVQASVRLSALTALISRQSHPGGAPAHTYPKQTAKMRERSRANPYTVTSPSKTGGDGSGWKGPALRSCVFPVRGRILPVHGSVVRVEHPAVLGRGEPGGCFTQSVIYTASSGLATANRSHKVQDEPEDDKNVAFVCFSLSYEEMAYGRQCHAFLTGLILDSVSLQDSQDNTVKIADLVYTLWTGQIKVEDFVSELMRIISPGRLNQREQLQRWLKLTLTLAQRYTTCLELLGKQHCRIISLFPGEWTTPVSQLTTAVQSSAPPPPPGEQLSQAEL